MKVVVSKGVYYYKDYKEARAILYDLKKQFPDARIVGYQKGWAIQYYVSGPYWPEIID
jgi:hypothetical protein